MPEPVEQLRSALGDRYRLIRELGAGGMATVYLAHDLRHDREVAVKVLRPELAATLGPQRFLQEIQIAARLTHPHILPLHDSGESGGFLFYVMPYIEGESLREKLGREGELPVTESVRILKEVTDALAYAHGHGVVHRDIKPENVMLSGRHALVTDFGVAKALHEATGRQRLTTAGVALGTPAYMAPEQAAADPHMDHRADIYAVGAMGYELLTGRPPFTGSSPQMVLAAHVTEQPRPVTDHRAAVPPAMAETIMRCLEKKPADRWQTAADLLAQFEALAATPSGGITPTTTRPIAAVVIPSPSRRRRVTLAAAGLAVTLAAAAGVWWYLSHRAPALVPDRIVVAPFENRTGDPAQDGLDESIVEQLVAAAGGEGMEVVTAAAIETERAHPSESRAEIARHLASRTGAAVVVTGSYYKRPGGVEYRAELLRMPGGTQIVPVDPTLGQPDRPESLKPFIERVLVAIAMNRESGEEFAFQGSSLPSKLASFQEVRRGDEFWIGGQTDKALGAMRQAEREDSTWFVPLLREADILLDASRFAQADTALRRLESRRARMKDGDQTYLAVLRARLEGDHEGTYRMVGRLAERMPRTWAVGRAYSAMITHRLEEAVRATDDRGRSSYWNTPSRRDIGPYLWRGFTLHMLGRDREALAVAQEMRRVFPESPIVGITVEIMARAGLRQASEVERLVAEAEGLRVLGGGWAYTRALVAAEELEAHGEIAAARRLYDRAIAWHREQTPLATASAEAKSQFGQAYYEARKWTLALDIFRQLVREAPDSVDYLGYYGTILAKLGQRDEALHVSARLLALRRSFLFGSATDYGGCIAAALGDKAGAVELLRRAESEGNPYRHGVHRDRCYDELRDYPPFQEFMRPKG